jgi:hypothetical protein
MMQEKDMKTVYIILSHCRGRTETEHLIFSSPEKAKSYCDEENSKPEPSMGWSTSYSFKEIELDAR